MAAFEYVNEDDDVSLDVAESNIQKKARGNLVVITTAQNFAAKKQTDRRTHACMQAHARARARAKVFCSPSPVSNPILYMLL